MTIRQQMKLLCTCLCRQDELYAAVSKRHGLSYHTAMTLYALDQDEGCTQKEIAKTWLIPKQTVNTVVKELERQGYVFFQTGKKEKQVRFTEAAMGEARFREMVEANRAFTEAFAREVQHG